MKKRSFVCLFLMFLLFGCSTDTTNRTIVCTGSIEGVQYTTGVNTIQAIGIDVTSLSSKTSIDYKSGNLDKEDIKAQAQALKEQYDAIEGVTYTFELDDTTLNSTIDIDFSKVNYDVLKEMGLIPTDSKIPLNYKRVMSSMQEAGSVCVQQ